MHMMYLHGTIMEHLEQHVTLELRAPWGTRPPLGKQENKNPLGWLEFHCPAYQAQRPDVGPSSHPAMLGQIGLVTPSLAHYDSRKQAITR